MNFRIAIAVLLISPLHAGTLVWAQEKPSSSAVSFGPYEYEAKPDGAEFAKFFPRKAPSPGGLLLRRGDRLAIIGDSITEQKMYSRMIETYLTVCYPQLEITARQYGWSGEKAEGFLRRMDQDCLRFDPTVATLCYGMNDSRYRPYDITNGQWYRENYTAIVQKLKASGSRVVVGSPGCAGKIASWVKSKSGTLDEHNLHLCALRDIGIRIAEQEQVRFADVFWPMYQAQVNAPKRYAADRDEPYFVAGVDGVHPQWAGQTIMAYAFLRAMGIDGDLGAITIDLNSMDAKTDGNHLVDKFSNGVATITSKTYPYCASGPIDDDNSIRSGTTLVPFHEQLNRFTLRVTGSTAERLRITWGDDLKEFDADELEAGILLAKEYPINPFTPHFDRVVKAVAAKQLYETYQIKKAFHGKEGRKDIEATVKRTEAERKPLADAIRDAMQPVTHQIKVEALK